MSQQIIAAGTIANDGTGDTLRAAAQKCNANFSELYTAVSALDVATAFVPTIFDSGGGRTFTQTINSARVSNIGNLRWFTVDLTILTATGTASGQLRIGTLPFVAAYAASVSVHGSGFANGAKTSIEASIPSGTSYIQIDQFETGEISSLAPHIQAGTRIVVTGIAFKS